MEAGTNDRTWYPRGREVDSGGGRHHNLNHYDRSPGGSDSGGGSGALNNGGWEAYGSGGGHFGGGSLSPTSVANSGRAFGPQPPNLYERQSSGGSRYGRDKYEYEYEQSHRLYHQDEYSDLYNGPEYQQARQSSYGRSPTTDPLQPSSSSHFDRGGRQSRPGSYAVSGHSTLQQEKTLLDYPLKDSLSNNRKSSGGGSRPTIEVSPGQFLPLHGSRETLQALHDRQLEQGYCCICDVDIYCVREANFILCPTCRTVLPLDDGSTLTKDYKSGGVGLGITAENFREWSSL